MLELSIVVPYFKKERTAVDDAQYKLAFLDGTHVPYELIAVVDGRVDTTHDALRGIRHQKLRIIVYKKNRGKGYAIRKGCEAAQGIFVGYIDGDRDIDVAVLRRMYEEIKSSAADIVYPNKYHHDSQCDISLLRRILSVLYQILVRVLFHIDVKDTQTGAKMYRRNVLQAILPHVYIDGFAFEIELFVTAAQLGYRNFRDVPVSIQRRSGSSIRYGTALRVVFDTLKIFLFRSRGGTVDV